MVVEKVTLEVLRAFSRARRAWSCFDVLLKAMANVAWTRGCAVVKNSLIKEPKVMKPKTKISPNGGFSSFENQNDTFTVIRTIN